MDLLGAIWAGAETGKAVDHCVRAAYRMMARVNVARLQDWAAQLDCCAINTVAGRQVSDAVWRIMADRDIQEAEEDEGTEDVFFCEMQ